MIDVSAIEPLTIVRGEQSNFCLIVTLPAMTQTGDTELVDLPTGRRTRLNWKQMRKMRVVGKLRQTDEGIVVAYSGIPGYNPGDICGLSEDVLPSFHRNSLGLIRGSKRGITDDKSVVYEM